MRKIRLIILMAVAWLALMPAVAYAQTTSEIAKQLICQCGCTAVLDNCTHEECSTRDQMLSVIRARLDKGQSGEEIVAFFVTQYGEKVLSSPPKRGFNLTAWIMPFVAILAGGAIVYVLIHRWVRQGKHVTAEAASVDLPQDESEYERRLADELKDFKMRGFR
ncbi:MAG: hypothetical protein A2137_04110 [Chloroflexi bacterium RBG_16_58_8]|nr:MAG: hypothetical protein A2137_04110 [Chloroflexi bacterium RBG_16_58_8]